MCLLWILYYVAPMLLMPGTAFGVCTDFSVISSYTGGSSTHTYPFFFSLLPPTYDVSAWSWSVSFTTAVGSFRAKIFLVDGASFTADETRTDPLESCTSSPCSMTGSLDAPGSYNTNAVVAMSLWCNKGTQDACSWNSVDIVLCTATPATTTTLLATTTGQQQTTALPATTQDDGRDDDASTMDPVVDPTSPPINEEGLDCDVAVKGVCVKSGEILNVKQGLIIDTDVFVAPGGVIEFDDVPGQIQGQLVVQGTLSISDQCKSGNFTIVQAQSVQLSANSTVQFIPCKECETGTATASASSNSITVLVQVDSSLCSNDRLSSGEIAGIAIGCVAIAALAVLLIALGAKYARAKRTRVAQEAYKMRDIEQLAVEKKNRSSKKLT